MSTAHTDSTSAARLDPSFGEAGRVVIHIPDTSTSVSRISGLVTDLDSRVLFTSSSPKRFLLGRLLEDGTVDRQFGNNGVIHDVFAEGDGLSLSTGVSILNNGTILLTGVYDPSGPQRLPALALFNASGHYVTEFGQYGKAVIPVPNAAEGSAGLSGADPFAANGSSQPPVILADGKMLLVFEGWLIRLLKNGRPDDSFDNGKHYRPARHPKYPSTTTCIVQASAETVVLAGTAKVDGEIFGMFARYFTNGELDRSFGRDGFVVLTDLRLNTNILALAMKDNDKVVGIGQKLFTPSRGLIVCLNAKGHLDPGFNHGNPVLVPTDANRQFNWHAGTIDHAGRIVATGGSLEGSDSTPYIATGRFTPDGSPDLTFSTNEGWVSAEGQLAQALAIDHKDRIVISGLTSPPENVTPVILRYLA